MDQRERLGETSKSFEARVDIWRRSDWARGRGGSRERRAADVDACDDDDEGGFWEVEEEVVVVEVEGLGRLGLGFGVREGEEMEEELERPRRAGEGIGGVPWLV